VEVVVVATGGGSGQSSTHGDGTPDMELNSHWSTTSSNLQNLHSFSTAPLTEYGEAA